MPFALVVAKLIKKCSISVKIFAFLISTYYNNEFTLIYALIKSVQRNFCCCISVYWLDNWYELAITSWNARWYFCSHSTWHFRSISFHLTRNDLKHTFYRKWRKVFSVFKIFKYFCMTIIIVITIVKCYYCENLVRADSFLIEQLIFITKSLMILIYNSS